MIEDPGTTSATQRRLIDVTILGIGVGGWLLLAPPTLPLEARIAWLGNILPIALLMRRPTLTAAMLGLLGCGAAAVLWRMAAPAPFWAAALLNIAEIGGVAWLIRRWAPQIPAFEEPFEVFRFFAATMVAVAAVALVAALVMPRMRDGGPVAVGGGWLLSHGCAVITLLPMLLWAASDDRRRRHAERLVPAVAVLGAVAVATAAAFAQPSAQMGYLVVPALLLATLQLRLAGAVLGCALILLVGGGALVIADAAGAPAYLPTYQLFLATMMISALLLTAALTSRDRAVAQTEAHAHVLALLSRQMNDIVFEARADGILEYLSPSFETVTGDAADRLIGKPAAALFAPSWGDAIATAFASLRAGEQTGQVVALSLQDADGVSRDMDLMLSPILDPHGLVKGFGGVLHDVSERRREFAALEAARQAAEAASERDALTGLANRRRFDRQIAQMIDETAVTGGPLALAMVDVDRFKRINDTHGHPVGDAVLCVLAGLARQHVRAADVVARIGGDEIAILLPGATAAAAAAMSRRLLEALKSAPIQQSAPGTTISIGVAQWRPNMAVGDLIAAADHALYAAKKNGRAGVQSSDVQ